MAVPNTTTFSLQDVVNEVNPSSSSLFDCVASANPILYDPTYYTSPATSLLEFRNYAGTVVALTMLTKGFTVLDVFDEQFVCSTNLTPTNSTIRYRKGNIIYTNSGGTIPFNGGDKHYAYFNVPDNKNWIIQVNSSGVIVYEYNCIF